MKNGDKWKHMREFFTYYERCVVHGCRSEYIHMSEYNAIVKKKTMSETTGDKAVSTATV